VKAPRVTTTYRTLLADRRTRRLLAGLGVSSLGDGISTVTIAWLAILVAPADRVGLLVGLALAAYTLPGVIGALAFASLLRGRSHSRRPASQRSCWPPQPASFGPESDGASGRPAVAGVAG
jgi:hypothetical protein